MMKTLEKQASPKEGKHHPNEESLLEGLFSLGPFSFLMAWLNDKMMVSEIESKLQRATNTDCHRDGTRFIELSWF